MVWQLLLLSRRRGFRFACLPACLPARQLTSQANAARPSHDAPSMGNQSSAEISTVALARHRQGTVVREIAKGGFSTVLLVETPDAGGCLVACKRVLVGSSKEAERDALREIAAHNRLGGAKPVSAYIAPLLESSVGVENGCKVITMVFPFYARGTLAKLLDQGPVSEASALFKFQCCAEALAAAHALGVAHCDVKTHNLILDGQDGVVLIDLGSSVGPPLTRAVASPQDNVEVKELAETHSSAAYRAPELWDVFWNAPSKRQAVVDYSACDVYAMGCVLYASCFPPLGFTPFESPSQGVLNLCARTATYKFPPAHETSQGLKELVQACLSPHAEQRPSARAAGEEAKRLREFVDFNVNF
jgi:serine/threonine protein kinase